MRFKINLDNENTRHVNNYMQYLAVLTASLCSLNNGLHIGWTSAALPILLSDNSTIPINTDEASWIVSCLPVGIILGGITVGYLFDRIGRKYCILITTIPFMCVWLIIGFTQNIYLIYFARIIAGIGVGIGSTIMPVYVAEISDRHIRGILGSIASTMGTLGILLSNIIGSYSTYYQTSLISTGIVIIFFITFVGMPETPYFYIMKKNIELARKSLRTLRGTVNVEEELNEIIETIERQTHIKGTYKELFFVKSNRYAFLLMTLLDIINQLCGITAIHSYNQFIFAQSGLNFSASTSAIIILSIQILIIICATYFVDCMGRKPLIIISISGVGFFLIIESIYFYMFEKTDIDLTKFNWVPLVAMILYIVAYSSGIPQVLTVMLGEVYSANIKAKASYINNVTFAVFGFLSMKLFMDISENVGMYLPFCIYSLCSFVGLILVCLFLPETKGKTLDEIQNWFKTGSYDNS